MTGSIFSILIPSCRRVSAVSVVTEPLLSANFVEFLRFGPTRPRLNMTVIENNRDRLLLRDVHSGSGFHFFKKLSFFWFFSPFLLLEAWFELSLKDLKLWMVSVILVTLGVMSFTAWFWRIEIELTKQRVRISERSLWRTNREETIPLQSVKQASFQRHGLRCQLVLITDHPQQHLIASGILEETLYKSALAINEFLRKHSPSCREQATQ